MNPNDMISGPIDWGGEGVDYIITAETHAARKPKTEDSEPKGCLRCGYDDMACSCSDCSCSYCVSSRCDCQSQPAAQEETPEEPVEPVDADDDLIAAASTPSLGDLFKAAKQSGLINSAVAYV